MKKLKQGFALWVREVLGKLEYFAILSNKEFLMPGISGIAGLTYLLDHKKSG